MVLSDPNINSGEFAAASAQGNPTQGNAIIMDVDQSTFMAEVMDASHHQPVVVDFWAPWCGPCKQLMPILEKCITEAGGAVKLAKVNIDDNQALAAQLRVQSVPTVYAFINGQPVDGFNGAQPESELRGFIDRLVQQSGGGAPDISELLTLAEEAIGLKSFAEAVGLFGQALELQPESELAMAGLIRCLTGTGDFEDAHGMIEAMTDEMQGSEPVQKAISALAIAEQAAESAGQLDEFEAALAANPEDPEAKFNMAVAKFGAGMTGDAIQMLLDIISKDREWNDGAARLKLLEIFEALGNASPEVLKGRRQLSSILFS